MIELIHCGNVFDLGGFARYSVGELSGAFKRGTLCIVPSSCYRGLVLRVSGPKVTSLGMV